MRAIGYITYKEYAKKYKIPLSYIHNGKRYKKSISELSKEIYEFETKNKLKGLYYY
jgi:hypothetical protein